MSYLGRVPLQGGHDKFDSLSAFFNNTATTFNLTINSVAIEMATPLNLTVVKNGRMLEPDGFANAYTVSGNTIIFTEPPRTTDTVWILRHGQALTIGINDGEVTDAKFRPASISYNKLSQSCKDTIISDILIFGN